MNRYKIKATIEFSVSAEDKEKVEALARERMIKLLSRDQLIGEKGFDISLSWNGKCKIEELLFQRL